MKRKIIIGIVALIAVVVVAGASVFFLAGRTSESGIADAVADLKAESITPRAPAPGLPQQGVYQLEVKGSETISRGPAKINRDLPETAPMIIRHTKNGYETEFRYSSGHTEWVRYRIGDDGASATWGQSEISAGVTTKRPRNWSPSPLRLPLSPKVGDTWEGDYKSGELGVRIESRVDREDTVTVAGEPVAVVVIESTQSVEGEYNGSRREQFYYSPDTGLLVRYVIESDLKGPVNFSYDVDQTVTSLEPLV